MLTCKVDFKAIGPFLSAKSDTCLVLPKPTRIVVTTPNNSNQSLESSEAVSNNDKTSPRSCSVNNIYRFRLLDEDDLSSTGSNLSASSRNFCKCRKCSLFDDCDPKEAKTVMKYLRFRKVPCSFFYSLARGHF